MVITSWPRCSRRSTCAIACVSLRGASSTCASRPRSVRPWAKNSHRAPSVRSPTAQVFAAYRAKPSTGERSAALAKALRDRKVTVALVRGCLHNDLLDAAERVAPAIADARKTASRLGIDLAMSGSGPSLFALGDDRAHAIRIARRLRHAGLRARVLRLGVTP